MTATRTPITPAHAQLVVLSALAVIKGTGPYVAKLSPFIFEGLCAGLEDVAALLGELAARKRNEAEVGTQLARIKDEL